jgi:hypothetical protein
MSFHPGKYTEAALTAAGVFVLSIIVSYTPVGKYVDRLAEAFHHDFGVAEDKVTGPIVS